jgi:hypothetical protein
MSPREYDYFEADAMRSTTDSLCSGDRWLYLQHSFWFLPNVAACQATASLLAEKHNIFWREYEVVVAGGASAGIGLEELPPVRKAIGSGFTTKTITLSCGKLTTGVTVRNGLRSSCCAV